MEILLKEIIRPVSIAEIILLFILFYAVLRFLHGTKGAMLFKGLFFLFVVLFIGIMLVTEKFRLTHIKVLLQWLLSGSFFVVLVVFAPEIRRGILKIAETRFPNIFSRTPHSKLIDELVSVAEALSARKVGALIAIEREVGLSEYCEDENATELNSKLSKELLETIFYPGSPLHDGGVVIRNDVVVAAGCLFPLTEKANLAKTLGTRHRAAIGITEESDAVVIVVSEETGKMSISTDGVLKDCADSAALKLALDEIISAKPKGMAIELKGNILKEIFVEDAGTVVMALFLAIFLWIYLFKVMPS
ncbi:TIGR00159 family protein [Candidatus Peregrinibacteria bacterium]|nr:TIGR00159 family protein [Candidatus Peregrinibacteria bacterium]